MGDNRLLVIEDERDIALLIEGLAQSLGFETRYARALVDVEDVVAEFQPTLIFADLNIVGGKDSDVLVRLAQTCTGAQLVIMSGSHYRRAAGVVADQAGLNIIGTLDKPFRLFTVREMLMTALQTKPVPPLGHVRAKSTHPGRDDDAS